MKLKVNIRGDYDAPRPSGERVPNIDELERIIRMATPRVSISLMAFSGEKYICGGCRARASSYFNGNVKAPDIGCIHNKLLWGNSAWTIAAPALSEKR